MLERWSFVFAGLNLALAVAAGAAAFEPGDIVLLTRAGKTEEARVVRQDQHGVLVQYKDWKDGTFHDDPAAATAYYQATELRPASGGARAPQHEQRPPATGALVAEAQAGARPQPAKDERRGSERADLADGEYHCYTYHPKAILAGAFTISGGSYHTRSGASGRYRMAAGGRIEWLGTPPLGFAVGVLEETQPKPKIRMYPQPGDVGNKWKAAVCTGDVSQPPVVATGVNPSGGAYAAGAKVEMNFAGYWYRAAVVRCSGARCLLKYDDPKFPDEWVETSSMRNR